MHPEVVTNTAAATFEVLVCTLRPGSPGWTGFTLPEARQSCASLTPFHSGTIRFTPSTFVVTTITAHRAGTVHISGMRVHYREGIREGDQVTGFDLQLSTGALPGPN